MKSKITLLVIIWGVLLLQACGGDDERPQPEEACHFQQNVYKQRVSWREFPVRIYVDSSLNTDQVESLKKAMEIWNESIKAHFQGQTAFTFAGTINGDVGAKDDRKNVISLTKNWGGKPTEQAETILIWYKKRILDADVRINGLKPLSTFNYVEANQLDTVALLVHELGHVLGLGEIRVEQYTAMNPYLSMGGANQRRVIGPVELNALKCEY